MLLPHHLSELAGHLEDIARLPVASGTLSIANLMIGASANMTPPMPFTSVHSHSDVNVAFSPE